MPAITAATISATARLISPLIQDLYKNAKGKVLSSLFKWNEASLPKKLAKKLHAIELVKTLWSPEEEVSLLKFYYPARIASIDRKAIKSPSSIADLGTGNLVIQGIVGQGKSIFLRYIAIQQLLSASNTKLPIFVELRTISGQLTLRQAIYKTLSTFDIQVNDETFDYLSRSGKTTLLLDGFDELAEDQLTSTLAEINFLSQKYSQLQIIVTSRPGNEIQKAPTFKVARIAPLNHMDYAPFFAKLGIVGSKSATLREAIKNSPNRLTGLITTPLMLTLIVIVHQVDKEIPPTLPEFFERLFQVVFTRHDRMKPGFERKRYTGLPERRLQSLFESFCFVTIQSGLGRSLSQEQFNETFDKAKNYWENSECDVENFRKDLTKVACLMLEEGFDTTTFLHKSVLEYYAAAFIKHCTDDVATLFYERVRQNLNPWRDVLRFLLDIDPYRYSKHFASAEIAWAKDKFLNRFDKNNRESILLALDLALPELQVTMGQVIDSNEFFEIQSYRHDGITSVIVSELFDLLIIAIDQTLPPQLTKEELCALLNIESNDIEMGSEYDITIRDIAARYGSSNFQSALIQFQASVAKQERDMISVIDLHERRKQLFLAPIGKKRLSNAAT